MVLPSVILSQYTRLTDRRQPDRQRIIDNSRTLQCYCYVQLKKFPICITGLLQRSTRFLQRDRIACNAKRCISHGNSVRPSVRSSVRPSVRFSVIRWYCTQTNEDSFLVSCSNNGWGRRPLPPKICAQSDPPTCEKRRLRPISANNVSTARASENYRD